MNSTGSPTATEPSRPKWLEETPSPAPEPTVPPEDAPLFIDEVSMGRCRPLMVQVNRVRSQSSE